MIEECEYDKLGMNEKYDHLIMNSIKVKKTMYEYEDSVDFIYKKMLRLYISTIFSLFYCMTLNIDYMGDVFILFIYVYTNVEIFEDHYVITLLIYSLIWSYILIFFDNRSLLTIILKSSIVLTIIEYIFI